MMRILLVTATNKEAFFFSALQAKRNKNYTLNLLVTGVGIVNTVFSLTKELAACSYDLIINAGICGSFDRTLHIAEPVLIVKDSFAELGIDDNGVFRVFPELDPYETIFSKEYHMPLDYTSDSAMNNRLKESSLFLEWEEAGVNTHRISKLKKVEGVTVQTVTGSDERRIDIQKYFHPNVESMEGAAVMFVSRKYHIPCIPIRTVSNYVEKRNAENWHIDHALSSLSDILNSIFD